MSSLLAAPRSSTPPQRPARTAAAAQVPSSPAAGRQLPGNTPPSPPLRAGLVDTFWEAGESKWGDVVSSLPLVMTSATDTSVASERRAPLPSRTSGCETSFLENGCIVPVSPTKNSPCADEYTASTSAGTEGNVAIRIGNNTRSRRAPGHKGTGSQRSCDFWRQHEEFALARSRELREAQAALDIPQPATIIAAGTSQIPPNSPAAQRPPPRGGPGVGTGSQPASPLAANGRPGGVLHSRPAPHTVPPIPVTTSLERLDVVRCEGETPPPPRARQLHPSGGAWASSVRPVAVASTALPSEGVPRAASCVDVLAAAIPAARPAPATSELRPSALEFLRLPTPCLSEMAELLRQRLQEQGQQISQLRAELSSRTRIAQALHACR